MVDKFITKKYLIKTNRNFVLFDSFNNSLQHCENSFLFHIMDKKSFIPLTINQRLKLQSPPPSSTSLLRRFQLGKPLRKLNYSISVALC